MTICPWCHGSSETRKELYHKRCFAAASLRYEQRERRKLGVTDERARQICDQALRKMRDELEKAIAHL